MAVDSKQTCWVYWIHLPEHTDITSEGYVGITTLGVEERYKRHLSASNRKKGKGRTQRINHAIAKYGDSLQVKTLLVGALEYCQLIENKLRPAENIGWNIAPGGAATRAGCKNSPEHIRKVVEANRGRKMMPEAVEQMKATLKKLYHFENGWEHPYAVKSIWAQCFDIFDYYLENRSAGRRTIGAALHLPPDSIMKLLNKMKKGWNPYTDSAYISWLTEYTKQEAVNDYSTQPA